MLPRASHAEHLLFQPLDDCRLRFAPIATNAKWSAECCARGRDDHHNEARICADRLIANETIAILDGLILDCLQHGRKELAFLVVANNDGAIAVIVADRLDNGRKIAFARNCPLNASCLQA
jgi:hypothetical protein